MKDKLELMDTFAQANSFACYKTMIKELVEHDVSNGELMWYINSCHNFITMYDPDILSYCLPPVLPRTFLSNKNVKVEHIYHDN